MPKKLLESAFIDILDIESEEFQQRKYFLTRQAIYIEKEIGLSRGVTLVALGTFEDRRIVTPELATRVRAIFPGNVFSLNEGESKKYSFYKNVLVTNPKSLRFEEQDNTIIIARDETLCTIVYDAIELNEYGQALVEEDHIPAISSYIKFKAVEKARLLSSLREGGNYYQLRNEAKEHERDYSLSIINARSNERYKQAEEVIEINDITIADDYFDFSA